MENGMFGGGFSLLSKTLLAATLFLALAPGAGVMAQERGQDKTGYRRGLKVPGADQALWIEQNLAGVEAVLPNMIGLQRINQRRAGEGITPLSGDVAVPFGQEFGTSGARTMRGSPKPASSGAADNSTLDAFPPISSQGSQGSCSAFATTYYQMTHNTALVRGWNAKTSGSAYHFSPKWTYNMINGGEDAGSFISDAMDVLADHGAPRWSQFPYTGQDSPSTEYTAWCLDSNLWLSAISDRMNTYYTIGDLHQTNQLELLKQVLDNGYVVGFDSYSPYPYNGWIKGTVGAGPHAGEEITTHVVSEDWGHAMTIVGYNDDIWVDINSNGVEDAGEKGALKIANSWGHHWSNSGHTWMAYDAIGSVSRVAGGPNPANRVYGIGYGDDAYWCRAYIMTARTNYHPSLVARFTARHGRRAQMTLRVGKGDAGADWPHTSFTGQGLHFRGGDLAFDGTPAGWVALTFALDATDLPPEEGVENRYFIELEDNHEDGYRGELHDFTLIDFAGNAVYHASQAGDPSSFRPETGFANGSTAAAWMDVTTGGDGKDIVSVVAYPASAHQGGATGAFVCSRAIADTPGTLTVSYTLSGTAVNGTDYELLAGSITFEGSQTEQTLPLIPHPEADIPTTKTAILTLTPSANYAIGMPSSATVTIHGDNPPVVARGSPEVRSDLKFTLNYPDEYFDFNLAGGSNAETLQGGFGAIGRIYFNHDETNLYVGGEGVEMGGSNHVLIVFVGTDTLSYDAHTLWDQGGKPYALDDLHNIAFTEPMDIALVLGDQWGDGQFQDFEIGSGMNLGQGIFYLAADRFDPVPGIALTQFDGTGTNKNTTVDAYGGQTTRWKAAIPLSALGAANMGEMRSLTVAALIASDGVQGHDRYLSGNFFAESASGSLDGANYGFNFVTITPHAIALPPPGSGPVLNAQFDPQGGLVLTWPVMDSRVYDVYWSTNLLLPDGGFIALATNLPSSLNTYTGQPHHAEGGSYYRIRMREPQ